MVLDEAAVPSAAVEVKRQIMREIRRRIRGSFTTRTEAARYLGLAQPTISAICTLQHKRYSIEWLVIVAARLGIMVEIKTRFLPLPPPVLKMPKSPHASGGE